MPPGGSGVQGLRSKRAEWQAPHSHTTLLMWPPCSCSHSTWYTVHHYCRGRHVACAQHDCCTAQQQHVHGKYASTPAPHTMLRVLAQRMQNDCIRHLGQLDHDVGCIVADPSRARMDHCPHVYMRMNAHAGQAPTLALACPPPVCGTMSTSPCVDGELACKYLPGIPACVVELVCDAAAEAVSSAPLGAGQEPTQIAARLQQGSTTMPPASRAPRRTASHTTLAGLPPSAGAPACLPAHTTALAQTDPHTPALPWTVQRRMRGMHLGLRSAAQL